MELLLDIAYAYRFYDLIVQNGDRLVKSFATTPFYNDELKSWKHAEESFQDPRLK